MEIELIEELIDDLLNEDDYELMYEFVKTK